MLKELYIIGTKVTYLALPDFYSANALVNFQGLLSTFYKMFLLWSYLNGKLKLF